MRRTLFWLLEGTKGGPTRIQLLSLLVKKPTNLRQLSLAAGLDYKTVEHHSGLLTENGIIEAAGSGYGKVYFVADSVRSDVEFKRLIRGVSNGGKKKK